MNRDGGNAKAKKLPRGKAQKGKGAERLKCSLAIRPPKSDLQLTVLARLRETDRSTLLNSILDDALRGVVVSLRGALALEDVVGQGGADTADAEAA